MSTLRSLVFRVADVDPSRTNLLCGLTSELAHLSSQEGNVLETIQIKYICHQSRFSDCPTLFNDLAASVYWAGFPLLQLLELSIVFPPTQSHLQHTAYNKYGRSTYGYLGLIEDLRELVNENLKTSLGQQQVNVVVSIR